MAGPPPGQVGHGVSPLDPRVEAGNTGHDVAPTFHHFCQAQPKLG